MRLCKITESHYDHTTNRSSRPTPELVTKEIESSLRGIDFEAISTNSWHIVDVPVSDLLVRERVVYDKTIEEFMDEIKEHGRFVNPSGNLSDDYYPLGVRFGKYIVVCDGTHRVEALIRLGHNKATMRVVDKWW